MYHFVYPELPLTVRGISLGHIHTLGFQAEGHASCWARALLQAAGRYAGGTVRVQAFPVVWYATVNRKLFVLGWVGGDTFDPDKNLGRSCICPFALSVRSPDFTNFSPFVRVFVCLSVTRIGSILYLSVCVICTFA